MSLTLVRSPFVHPHGTIQLKQIRFNVVYICHANNVHYDFYLVWMNVLIVHHNPTFITSSSKPLKDQCVFGKVSQPKTECLMILKIIHPKT